VGTLNSQDLKRKEEDHKSLEFYTIHLKNTTGIMIKSLVLFTDGEPPKSDNIGDEPLDVEKAIIPARSLEKGLQTRGCAERHHGIWKSIPFF
jgi:hypothetical protein